MCRLPPLIAARTAASLIMRKGAGTALMSATVYVQLSRRLDVLPFAVRTRVNSGAGA